GNVNEMFPELAGHIFVTGIFFSQLQCDGEQVQRIHRHPTCAVRLFNVTASGQGRAAVEYADIVQPKEAALKDVHALSIFAVYPPGEIQHQLMKDTLQEGAIALALTLLVNFVDAPCRPGMNWRIHIAECPFIGWNLAVWMH